MTVSFHRVRCSDEPRTVKTIAASNRLLLCSSENALPGEAPRQTTEMKPMYYSLVNTSVCKDVHRQLNSAHKSKILVLHNIKNRFSAVELRRIKEQTEFLVILSRRF